jgi:hypothetical protein
VSQRYGLPLPDKGIALLYLLCFTLCRIVCLCKVLLVLLWPKTQGPNNLTNVSALTFVDYSLSATCFGYAGSSSGSFQDLTLVTEL